MQKRSLVARPATEKCTIQYSRNPNLKRYIASVGWSDTCVYAGGSSESAYEGGASDSDSGSTEVDCRSSSWRLSRVPVRLRVRRELDACETPKKASTASVAGSSKEVRCARGAWVRTGVGCGSCASISSSGVAVRSKRPKKVGRAVEEEADIVV